MILTSLLRFLRARLSTNRSFTPCSGKRTRMATTANGEAWPHCFIFLYLPNGGLGSSRDFMSLRIEPAQETPNVAHADNNLNCVSSYIHIARTGFGASSVVHWIRKKQKFLRGHHVSTSTRLGCTTWKRILGAPLFLPSIPFSRCRHPFQGHLGARSGATRYSTVLSATVQHVVQGYKTVTVNAYIRYRTTEFGKPCSTWV